MLTGLLPLPFLLIFRKQKKLLVLACIAIVLFICGNLRYSMTDRAIDDTQARYYNGSTVVIKGMIAGDPDIRDKGTQLEIATKSIQETTGWRAISGKVLIFTPVSGDYKYGDILLLKGNLVTPAQLGSFDYQGYLANRGIYSSMSYPRNHDDGARAGKCPDGLDLFCQKLAGVEPGPRSARTAGWFGSGHPAGDARQHTCGTQQQLHAQRNHSYPGNFRAKFEHYRRYLDQRPAIGCSAAAITTTYGWQRW